MAYQARAAIDRIKFAIKYAEQFAPRTEQMCKLEFQLLDAPERLKKWIGGFRRGPDWER